MFFLNQTFKTGYFWGHCTLLLYSTYTVLYTICETVHLIGKSRLTLGVQLQFWYLNIPCEIVLSYVYLDLNFPCDTLPLIVKKTPYSWIIISIISQYSSWDCPLHCAKGTIFLDYNFNYFSISSWDCPFNCAKKHHIPGLEFQWYIYIYVSIPSVLTQLFLNPAACTAF